ncbi:hypothetical protein O181_128536 [Austropuccinia psidii MF-1]|uniref:Uncharacterized protein n=1 Tax=Austropuccinia psidii MF-1 TaxID=1389203 RepID=A0A9Q3KZ44_9BASI|nr:hypothetical protein [Austropuccinia psidii MF-1]
MSPVHLRDLGFQRNQPEDREDLSRTRRPERGHPGHSSGWQNNEGDNINPAIHTPIQWRPQTRGLERHGSSSSAPPTPQGPITMEHGQQEVQPGISLGRTWSKLPEDLSQRDRLQRPYDNHQRLESYQAVQTPGGRAQRIRENQATIQAIEEQLTQTGPTQIPSVLQGAGQIISPLASHHSDTDRSMTKSRHSSKFQEPKAERIRPHDPEFVGFGERSAQEPEVVVNHSRISSSSNRNITPTQTEHNIATSEININSDTLWLQMSQYAEQSAKQFAELEASHERMKKLTAPMDKIIKNLQEGHSQLRKASEETNKRLILVSEEQHHSRRDRDFWTKT